LPAFRQLKGKLMDEFDYKEQTRPTYATGDLVWNTLTVVVLLAALGVGAFFLAIFINPQSGLNLFPPPTLPAALAFPTATPTPRGLLPATWTPLPTMEPSATSTTRPSATPTVQPTETPFALFTPSTVRAGTATPGGLPYVLSKGSPVPLSSVAFYPDLGCNWQGVAGQVVDLNGAPVSTGIIIQLGGTRNGQRLEVTSLTGVAPQYGPAGYEIFLGDKPIAARARCGAASTKPARPVGKVTFDTFLSVIKI
jgi:hypothetical protein